MEFKTMGLNKPPKGWVCSREAEAQCYTDAEDQNPANDWEAND